MQGVMYFGAVVGFLLLTIGGNWMGRRMLMISNLWLAMFGLILSVCNISDGITAFGLFLSIAGVRNGFNICYYFIAETMDDEKRAETSVLIQFYFGIGMLMNVPTFLLLNNWKLVLVVAFILPLAICIIGFITQIKDTPMCLVLRYPAQDALAHFRYIA